MKIEEVEQILLQEGYACKLIGDSQVEVDGFSDPGDYRSGTMIWLGDLKYLQLKENQSYKDVSLLLCKEDLEGKDNFLNLLVCDDPRNAFMRLLELYELETHQAEPQGIDQRAIVDDSVVVGKDVYIGPGSVIGKGVVLGDGTRIMPNAYLEFTTTGKNCLIFPGCVIGVAAHGYRRDKSLAMEPHIGRVVLGNNVNVLAGSVIERGTVSNTVIGDDTKIANMTNVGHNTKVGKRCQINGGKLHGGVTVGDDTEIICSFVANRVKIGSNVKIGLNSTVVRDIPDHSIAFGSPAKVKGEH